MRRCSALDLDRLLRGRRGGGHAEVRRGWRALAQLDDPEAVHAVRDLERVVELPEQLGRAVELEQVVVGVAALAHLVSRRAQAPVVPRHDLALALDDLLEAREDVRATLLLGLGVKEEYQVVDRLLGGHAAAHGSNARGRSAGGGGLRGACRRGCDGATSGGPSAPWRWSRWWW